MWLIVAALVGLVLLRNVVTKDYSGKQKSYLREIGRDDLVPKTARERSDEAIAQQEQVAQLMARLDELEAGHMALRAEVKALRSAGRRAAPATTIATGGANADVIVDLIGGDDR